MTQAELNGLYAQTEKNRQAFLQRAREGFSYWKNETDILGRGTPIYEQQRKADCRAPMRFADNRVPHNFHRLLVGQKAGYFASWAPVADTGDDGCNRRLTAFLHGMAAELYQLSVDASNCGEGWLHFWRKKEKSGRDKIAKTGLLRIDNGAGIWYAYAYADEGANGLLKILSLCWRNGGNPI